MNYRHKLLNQQNKNQLALKEQAWKLERQNLQQDIINLENSADIKLLEQTQKKSQELEKLLNGTIDLLGKEEIKNLEDIRNLLRGKSLKELVEQLTLYQQKIQDQDTALFNLARQKLTGKKEAQALLNNLATNFSQQKTEWEKEKEQFSQELTKNRETITNLEQEKSDQFQQIKTLSSNNDKLSREKDSLVLDKNNLNEELKQLKADKQKLAETIRKGEAEKQELAKELKECKRERESKKNWWGK